MTFTNVMKNNTHPGKMTLAPDIQHEHQVLNASAEGASAVCFKLLKINAFRTILFLFNCHSQYRQYRH